MERKDCVILINSTPKYYFILPMCITMLRRYAPSLVWDVVLATEVPDDPVCQDLAGRLGVTLLTITETGFLESRREALSKLKNYAFCLPLQDDFLLEMACDGAALREAFQLMEDDPACVSVRLMPCPGPKMAGGRWAPLDPSVDTYGFVFQATLWRTEACLKWYEHITAVLESRYPAATTLESKRRNVEIVQNIAENSIGQREFWAWTAKEGYRHLAWVRKGTWPNAVYLSPFPYRPTAIVRGSVEPWVYELALREGITLPAALD
jgi:hypothetical protein